MSENQMTVSNSGLLYINKKLIGAREYSENLIDTQGNVSIENGVASNFDNESYLYKSGLNITSNEITVTASGIYYPYEREQVLWFLAGDNATNENIILQFSNNTIELVLNSQIVISFSNLNFEDNTNFKAVATLTNNKYELTVFMRDTVYHRVVNLTDTKNLPALKSLYIGNDQTDLEEYWEGSIELNDFTIDANRELIYTPSYSTFFTFSKILISDGEYHLQDNSIPVAKHVYQFDAQEVTRNNNTIIFSLQLDENVRLTIKEIGLYIEVNGKQVLFSYIKGLNIRKDSDVPYDLIFTVNLSLEFLNVTGFPDENSFLLEAYKPALYKDFKDIRDIQFYIISSLERLIYKNAERIGYDKAQEYYKLQQDIEQEEDCYSNIQSYSNLKNRLRIIDKILFMTGNISLNGSIIVSNDGEATDFSTTNYISANAVAPYDQNWSTTLKFSSSYNASWIETLQEVPSSNAQMLSVAYGNSKFLALGGNGYIATSRDGLNFEYTVNNSLKNRSWYSLIFANNKFLALSSDWYITSSSNGSNWKTPVQVENLRPKNTFGDNYIGLTYGNGIYVALGEVCHVSTSPDGINWTVAEQNENLHQFYDGSFSGYTALCYGNGKFVALGLNGLYSTSTNGIDWDVALQSNELKGYNWGSLIFDGEKFTALSTNGFMSISENGTTWSTPKQQLTQTLTWWCMCYGNDTLVSMGNQFSPQTFYSGVHYGKYTTSESTLNSEIIATFVGQDQTDPEEENWVSNIKSLVVGLSSDHKLFVKMQKSYSGEYIINQSNLLDVLPYREYFVRVEHEVNENNHIYNILSSKNGRDFDTVFSIETQDYMSSVTNLYLGVEATYNQSLEENEFTNPFSSGTIYLMNCNILSNIYNWTNIEVINLRNTNLLQYYRIPDLYKSYYIVSDINNQDYQLTTLENELRGNQDIIDFSNNDGFSLNIKVFLKNESPKVLLAKTDLENNPYFILTYFNRILSFTLYTEDNQFTLQKKVEINEAASYHKEPITLSITLDKSRNLKLYKNNELISQFDGIPGTFKNASSTFLTNFIQESVLREICNTPTILENLTLEEFITNVNNNQGRYIQNIIATQGVISSDDLYYINNLMDTNY